MSNTTPNPKDDLDFSLAPAAPGTSHPAKKGPARSWKVLLLAAFVIAEGAAIGAMALSWPRAAPVPMTYEVGANDQCSVEMVQPYALSRTTAYVCANIWNPVKNYSYQAYLSYPLDPMPASFDSAIMRWGVNSDNFTWWNVSLVTVPWTSKGMNWTTRPPFGPFVTSIPVEKSSASPFFNGPRVEFNVTDIVRGMASGANLSFCVSPTGNTTEPDGFMASIQYSRLFWTVTPTPDTIPGPSPLLVLAMGLIAAAWLAGKRRRAPGPARVEGGSP